MSRPLKVLLVEDSEADALLVLRELRKGGFAPESERVESAESLDRALDRAAWDVVLADYQLPGFSAPRAFEAVEARVAVDERALHKREARSADRFRRRSTS